MAYQLSKISFTYRDRNIVLCVPKMENIKALFDSEKASKQVPYWGKIWPSAEALSQYIIDHSDIFLGKNVLELGAGLGLPSLVASQYAKNIICSDYDMDAVSVMQQNITLNQGVNITSQLLDWREMDINASADIILISDLNYEPDLFDALYNLLTSLLLNGKIVLLATPQRLMAKSFIYRLLSFVKDSQEFHISDNSNTSESWVNVFLLEK